MRDTNNYHNPIYGTKGDIFITTRLPPSEYVNCLTLGANKGDRTNGPHSFEVSVCILDPDNGRIQKGSSMYGSSLGD